MFDFLKKKPEVTKQEIIYAPIAGEAVASEQISDPTFGEEMLGKGLAIKPTEGKVYAPVDGMVAMIFDTKHAINLISEQGAEILIHVGLDTVRLKGEHFTAHVTNGEQIKKGELLLEFDIEAIKAAGFDTISPIVICNSDDYSKVERITGMQVNTSDTVMKLEK